LQHKRSTVPDPKAIPSDLAPRKKKEAYLVGGQKKFVVGWDGRGEAPADLLGGRSDQAIPPPPPLRKLKSRTGQACKYKYNKPYRRARPAPTPVGDSKKMSERRTVALTTAGGAPAAGSAPAAATVGSCSGWLSIITPTSHQIFFVVWWRRVEWSGGGCNKKRSGGRGRVPWVNPSSCSAQQNRRGGRRSFPGLLPPTSSLFFSIYSLQTALHTSAVRSKKKQCK
jgi:hypothetical protein